VEYEDMTGFCKAAKLSEIRNQRHILTPGRYVGVEEEDDDEEEFEDRLSRLSSELIAQFKEANVLDKAITKNLEELGFA